MPENEQDQESEPTTEDLHEGHSYLMEMEEQVVSFFQDIPDTVHEAFRRHRRTVFERHPFLFSTLGLFGLVAVWQGFDDLIERVQLFDQYPSLLLGAGLIILLLTGRLYRHLDEQ